MLKSIQFTPSPSIPPLFPHHTKNLSIPLPTATIAASLESDRYALPPLQYDDGDVLIKLGHEQSDWLVVHSENLSESSKSLKATLSSEWAATIGIDEIKHPSTGEEVRVKTMALKYVEGAYFLEGKEVLPDLHLDAEVFQDTQWCEGKGWPRMGADVFGRRSVLDMTKRAFKVLVAAMHDIDPTLEQVAGQPDLANCRKEDIGASIWVNEILFPQIVTVCAIAEFLDCLTTVGPAMMVVLHSAPRYWQAVAYKPLQHMMLAFKLKSSEVYLDAYQHALAQAYHNDIDGVTWDSIAAITGSTGRNLQAIYTMQFRRMAISAENLRMDLHRLQTGAGQGQQIQGAQNSVWSIFGTAIAGPGYDAEADAKEHYTLIARSIYGEWLAQHLYTQHPRLSPPRYRSEDPNVDPFGPNDAPALRFNLAVHRLEQAAFSEDPTSMFGLSIPRRFASYYRPFDRKKAEEGITEALADLIEQAGIAIERFRNLDLTLSTVDHAEYDYQRGIICGLMKHRVFPMPHILHFTGGCHFDGHDFGYFTCLKIRYAVPFATDAGESMVFKCEPLDSETLLVSQQWMDRVFEPYDEKRQPFVLTPRSIIDLLKLLGVLAFSFYIGKSLLSL